MSDKNGANKIIACLNCMHTKPITSGVGTRGRGAWGSLALTNSATGGLAPLINLAIYMYYTVFMCNHIMESPEYKRGGSRSSTLCPPQSTIASNNLAIGTCMYYIYNPIMDPRV